MRYLFVVASRNSVQWIKGALDSIAAQDYTDYDVVVVDDASTDGQPELIAEYCTDKGWNYVLNEERMYGVYNQLHAIRNFAQDEEQVVVFVDGDDALAHPGVLSRLEDYYGSGLYDLTYGSYASVPYSKTCPPVRPYPDDVIKNRTFRSWMQKNGVRYNHLRTFKAGMILGLDDKNFRTPDGVWLTAGTDLALMTPALERAGSRHKYIKEILYNYNSENPQSDWRVHLREVRKYDDYIYSLDPVA